MLLELTRWLAQFHNGFKVFSYLTLRAILAALTALVISLLVGPRMIEWLRGKRVRNDPREYVPQEAGGGQIKRHTPTMGGMLILVALVAGTLLWSDLSNRFIWTVLAVTLVFGAVGFYVVTSILGAIDSIGPIRYGFPTFYGGAWSDDVLFGRFTDDMWRDLLLQIPYLLVFVGVAVWWFRRKDITN